MEEISISTDKRFYYVNSEKEKIYIEEDIEFPCLKLDYYRDSEPKQGTQYLWHPFKIFSLVEFSYLFPTEIVLGSHPIPNGACLYSIPYSGKDKSSIITSFIYTPVEFPIRVSDLEIVPFES